MSYEIIKNIKVIKRENGYFCKVTSASNNVYPHYYSEWEYPKNNGYLTKEELEKDILLDFFHGNFQGGSSKYAKAVKRIQYIDNDLLDRYYKLDRVYGKVSRRLYKLRNENSSSYEYYSKLAEMLYAERTSFAKNTLYSYMMSGGLKNTKRFTIRDKYSSDYVIKVNSRTYRIGRVPKVFTSVELWYRVNNSKWWQDNFVVECV